MPSEDDFTRGPVGRPDHADMRALIDLVLQLDGQASEGGLDVGDMMRLESVDEASITYLAIQRVVRAESITGTRYTLIQRTMAAGLYFEAFILGNRWATRKAAERP